jgi:hypothetical protein
MSRRTKRIAALLIALLPFGLLIRAAAPQVPANTWATAGDMTDGRAAASAVLMFDGRVLVSGGITAAGVSRSVERYSPGKNNFLATPAMQEPRANHTSTLLPDGRVLVVGGTGVDGAARATTEIYDPATNAWTAAATLHNARSGHTATALYDGRIVITGGDNAGATIGSIEVYDPSANVFVLSEAALPAPVTGHAAALLYDGRVLITGGFNGTNAIATALLFDPFADTLSTAAPLTASRAGHSATTLLSGKVLIAGGASDTTELATAEVYDPASDTFTPAANSLSTARQRHTAVLLPHNNQVLIVGGTQAGHAVPSADVYVEWQGDGGTFFPTRAPIIGTRAWAAAAALSLPAGLTVRTGPNDGLILLAGGSASSNAGSPAASAELYGFATVKTDHADYAPGTTVTITGSGWMPGETVALTLVEQPRHDTHALTPVVADGSGNIVSTEFIPDAADLGIRFLLTASGEQSQAQTTFTDGNIQFQALPGPNPVFTANVTVDQYPSGATACVGTKEKTDVVSVANNAQSGLGVGNSPFVAVTAALSNSLNQPFTAWYSINGTATAANVICVAGTNIGSQVWRPAYGGPTRLAFTNSSVNATAGTCSQMTVQTQDGAGNPANPVLDITVALSSTSAGGTFYNSNACATSNQITTVPMTTSGNSATFWYKDATIGSPTVRAHANQTTLADATQTESIALCAAPSIGTQPSNATITYGADATFTAAASGTPTPTVQWQQSIDGGATFTNLPGATTTNLLLTKPPVSTPARKYRAVFSNTCGGTQTATTAAATLTVNQSTLTVTGVSAQNKVYDATTAAILNTSSAVLAGVAPGDSVTLNTGAAAGTFAGTTVGSGITVQVSGLTITGASAGNYTLTQPTATANITAKSLAVTGLTAGNKTYDGALTATVNGTPTLQAGEAAGSGTSSDGKPYAGDTVSVTGTSSGAFASKSVGTAITVTVTGLSLSGDAATNYTLSTPALTADITAKPLTVTGVVANDKVYDGTTAATLGTGGAALSGVIGGDTVLLTSSGATATFADKNAGTSKPVTAAGFAISGTDAGNYSFAQPTGLTASITTAHLTVTAGDKSKNYDGAVFSAFTATISGFIAGETEAALRAAGALSGNAGFTGEATTAVNARIAPYTITPTLNNLAAANYDFTAFVNGALTINRTASVVTWSAPAGITYPTALGATQLNATASVPGSFTYTPAAGTVLDAGTRTLHVDFSPADATNYTAASAEVSIAVAKGTPVINWSNPANITYPTRLGAVQLNATVTGSAGGESPLEVSELILPTDPTTIPDFTQINDCAGLLTPAIWTGFCTPVWHLPVGTPELAFGQDVDHGVIHYDKSTHLLTVDARLTAVYFNTLGTRYDVPVPADTRVVVRAIVGADGKLIGGALFIEGYFARVMYISLYKMHLYALHGFARVFFESSSLESPVFLSLRAIL